MWSCQSHSVRYNIYDYTHPYDDAANVASFSGSVLILVRSNGMRVPQRGESGNEATANGLSTFYVLPMAL